MGRKTNIPDMGDEGRETISELKEFLGDEFENYYSFSFVRNPWDRFVSAYHYVCQRRPHITSVTSHQSFSDFAKAFASDPEEYQKIRYFRPQVPYLVDTDGALAVDFVGRLENFEGDLQKVLGKLGIRRKIIRHRKKSARADYRQYFSAKEKDAIAEAYARDIEYFDYKFEDGREREKRSFLDMFRKKANPFGKSS